MCDEAPRKTEISFRVYDGKMVDGAFVVTKGELVAVAPIRPERDLMPEDVEQLRQRWMVQAGCPDEARPLMDDRQRQRLARREEVRQILAAPLARPVPPEILAEEPPRNAEGMLIGWPQMSDDEAWARRTMTPICRALRVDPDGPLEPMMPAFWWNAEACMRKDAEREHEECRDAALVRALRFT